MSATLTDFSNSDYPTSDTSGMGNVPWFSLLTMVTISASLSFMAEAQDCFGGIETFEKMVSMGFTGVVSYKPLLQQPGQAITRDCINLCKQQAACLSFSLNYTSSSCVSYNVNSIGRGDDIVQTQAVNFFEKICFRGVSKDAFDSACRDRLWVFDRVRDAYLEGHVDREAKNVRTKEDCEKLCITEERFKCRSADYDEIQHTCRMSRETRRTKPNSFKIDPGSGRNYLENQCAPPPPASCRYETKSDSTLLTSDYLQFAASATDCMDQCDAETAFNCWAYSYVDNRCQLSGDSSLTWGKDAVLPSHPGAVYGELRCFFEQCDNGVMTFEKMTGVLLRSAQGTMMKVSKPGALGNTLECAKICIEDGTECPAFSDHYHNMRCDRLDRNSNGRTQELIARDGENYFEKICLQGPEAQACNDKAWAFERALGYELADNLYQKTIAKVETRTACIQLCLSEREFTCRSARYDEDSGQCKLSPADRRTEPMKYYRSEDARVSYLENSCLPVDTTCTYVETEDAYPTYANIIQTDGVSTLESCREMCTTLKTFSCRSFSYYSSALQCFLSGDDKASGGSAAIQRRPGIMYFERMCPQATTNEIVLTETTAIETTVTSPLPPEPTLGISSNTQAQFQETETTLKAQKTRPPYQPQEPSRSECSPTERLIFEKLTGYEPFGVTSTLLFRGDSSTPGITAECVRRCQTLSDCRSFVLDHQRFECSSVQDPPSIHPADFRSAIGKTVFGGLCVPAYVGCSKLWVYERIMDHELQGIAPIDVIRVVSLEQCQQHCLETRKYVCRSANYFHLRRECQIFGDDRSAPKAHLVKASRVDFFENQCLVGKDTICNRHCYTENVKKNFAENRLMSQLSSCYTNEAHIELAYIEETSFCPYQKSEENQAMVYVTKSLTETPSTLHCERECNREREFNCRSYTFWDQGARGSICMLSGESRLTDQSIGISYRDGATYSGKNCKISISDRGQGGTTIYPPITEKGTTETFSPRASQTPPYKPVPPPPPHPPPLPPYKPPPPRLPPPMPHMPPPVCSSNQFTYEKVIGHDVRGGRRERVPTRLPIGVVQACRAECQRLGERCQGFVVQYKSYQNCYVILREIVDDAILVPSLDSVYFNKVCLREHPCKKIWSFERFIHHELHSEPIRETSEVLERADCEDLCLMERPLCKSAVYNYHDRTCRLFAETKRSATNRFLYSNEEVEYLENQCVSDSPTCQYRDFPDRFLPQIDRLSRAFNLKDCQRQCDTEREFTCRSVNFETVARDCALSSEDVSSVPQGVSALQNRRNSLYSEKGNCEQVSVQCNPQDMLLTIHFDTPFHGRVYAKGNPSQCFVVGTGQSSLQFAISMGSRCGTTAETTDQFVNEVVVQQHPVIMTDDDKTIKVICSFETQERTYTMAGPGVGGPGVDVARSNLKAPLTAVVTNTAPPPNVAMRVLDRSGRDARAVGLGEELTLKIELREPSSAFAIFARNLYARSTNGESLFLIDSSGCPTDATIFPALELDPNDHKSLQSTFKAFRFPTSGMVNFEVQIRFCQEKCEQVRCGNKGASYGRKKREIEAEKTIIFNTSSISSLDDEDVYFDGDNYDAIRAVIQDEAHSIVFPSKVDVRQENSQMQEEEEETGSTENYSTVKGYFNTEFKYSTETEQYTNTEHNSEVTSDVTGEMSAETSVFQENEEMSQTEPMTEVKTESVHETAETDGNIDKNGMIKEHLMSESHKGDNMYDVATNIPNVGLSTEEIGGSKEHASRNMPAAVLDRKESLPEFITISEKITSKISPNINLPQKETYYKLEDSITQMTIPITSAAKTTENNLRQNQQPSTSFNRKFAFIYGDENNSTNSYTTPISNLHNDEIRTIKTIANDSNIPSETYHSSFYPRPDIRGYGGPHSSNPARENPARPYWGSERWSTSRKDPFSANRNPYSANTNQMAPNVEENKNAGHHSSEKIHPLPLHPQKLVDHSNSNRPWNAPKAPSDIIPGHSHNQPPPQPHPIEIQEVPSTWESNQNTQVSEAIHRPPLNAHYNIFNSREEETRQTRVVTTSPNFHDRAQDIKITNTNAWAPNVQSSSDIQIQRPLEILDYSGQRHGRPAMYQTPHLPNNQPRPLEIPNHQIRNPGNTYNQQPYPNNRYDYNRIHMQPRPMELPNQQPNAPSHWNGNQNNLNVHTAAPTHLNSNNNWNNNPPQNARPPQRNPNKPEENRTPQRQAYPQPPTMQDPQRSADKWRNSQGSPSNSNSAPARNNFYASQPQYRPSEVIATTQKAVPEEVPLSLAILVGEDGKSQNSAQQKPKQPWRPPPQYNRGLQRHNIINTPRPAIIEDDKVCTSKATIIATAVSVTLIYLGVVAGAIVGYRWHRKNKRRKAMSTTHPIHFPPNPTNVNVTYSTPDVTFRNVYGNFPVNNASTT